MNHNTPHDESGSHDESGYLLPRQGAYNNRFDGLMASIEDRITFLLDDNRIDELSAYEREQLLVKYYGLLLRLLPLHGKVEQEQIESQIDALSKAELEEAAGPQCLVPGVRYPDEEI